MYPVEDNCNFSMPWGYIIPLIIGSQFLSILLLNKLVNRHDDSCNNTYKITSTLIGAGADVNVKNNLGETPLHCALSGQRNLRDVAFYLAAKEKLASD